MCFFAIVAVAVAALIGGGAVVCVVVAVVVAVVGVVVAVVGVVGVIAAVLAAAQPGRYSDSAISKN